MSKETLPERKKVADQIRLIRNLEKGDFPQDVWSRDMQDYVEWLSGISIFLNYVRKIQENGLVIDIGSGRNIGITQIARSKFGEGLSFVGTNLTKVPGSVEDTSPVRIIRTSAEVLRGIPDESVSGMFALASIAYSESPSMVASSIDRVLVPGGAIKAAFKPKSMDTWYSEEYSYKTHNDFSQALVNLGYDVANKEGFDEVVLAIKPGGKPQPYNLWGDPHTAQTLVKADSGLADMLSMYEEVHA